MGQLRLRPIQHDIMKFMQAAGQEVRATPTVLPRREIDLRISLICEEYDETIDALIQLRDPSLSMGRIVGLLADVADGVVDLMYVLVGTTLAMGIDLEDIWAEVQRANMDKMAGPVRQDGKRLKPDDWQAPQVGAIIRAQQERRPPRPEQVPGQLPLDSVRGWNCS